jgi:putative membrane-bound dehydrogenase-like protein
MQKTIRRFVFSLFVILSICPQCISAETQPLAAGLSPTDAAKRMKLPPGFRATLFAGEPDIRQPIAMALDDRGRLWVAEAYAYPRRRPEGKGEDRILIFSDTDGDGHFDERKVFIEKLNLVSGLEVGFGGVWVGAAPNLFFIPDKDGDDKPDGPPQILLDGWGYEDTHETLNSFIWGPDGWLYGCHGVFTHSRVGKPGTPPEKRERLNAAIWRYHPTRHEFEVFAHGTSNPWGVDFNDMGHAFSTACVIPHLFHVIQAARYERQAGTHFNTHTYDDIKTIADHRHFAGEKSRVVGTNRGKNDPADKFGGGHAHAGAMIYLGGTWPEKYRNQIFMNNIHGQRVNMDLLARNGSGYVGSHGPDFLFTFDSWSQILNLRAGPDGQVYLIDWYDRYACHNNEPQIFDRGNGRIFKISYGKEKRVAVDIQKMTDQDLARQMLLKNDWYVRHARRNLQERAAVRDIHPEAQAILEQIAFTNDDVTRRLRGLWALHVIVQLNEARLLRALNDTAEEVRSWAVQLACEKRGTSLPKALLSHFETIASRDPSPLVRLYLASALQRMPLANRWTILAALTGHAEDARDHNLPLMYWYAAEPLAAKNPRRALALGLVAGETIPVLRKFMIRRIGGLTDGQAVALLWKGLKEAKTPTVQLAYLAGIRAALRGRRDVTPPQGWKELYAKLAISEDAEVKLQNDATAVAIGHEPASKRLRELLADQEASPAARRTAPRWPPCLPSATLSWCGFCINL